MYTVSKMLLLLNESHHTALRHCMPKDIHKAIHAEIQMVATKQTIHLMASRMEHQWARYWAMHGAVVRAELWVAQLVGLRDDRTVHLKAACWAGS